MIRTYISISLKYLVRQPSYSVLSILGFTLAFASLYFIYSHVSYQISYDRHLKTCDRVYRLSGEINLPDNENIHAQLGPRLGPVMKEEIPAIEQMTRLVAFEEKCIVTAGEQNFFEDHVYFADTTVFDVFPLNFLYGTPKDALLNEGQVIISESQAIKYFGTANALGRQLRVNHDRIFDITGITRDLPGNVHHKLHMLLSMKSLRPQILEVLDSDESENYWRPFAYNFIMLGENNSIEEVEKVFPDFFDKYMAEFGSFLKAEFKLIFTPLPDIHFTPQFTYDFPKGNRSYSYLLVAAGLFLLLIALLNYANLLSASMASRSHSLGIFKINGAERSHLFKLLITESLLLLVISILLTWFLVSGVDTWFMEKMGAAHEPSAFRFGSFLMVALLVLAAISLAFMLAVISRVYRQPVILLKGESSMAAEIKRYGFGKGSIVLQFTLSVILIIASLLVSRQVNYLLRADVGYATDNIVHVKLHAEDVPLERIHSFKQELLKNPHVQEVAYSSNVPGEALATSHFKMDVDGQEASRIVSLLAIDADYIPLMQMELKEGRNFDRNRPTDPQSGVILNEACVDFLGMGDSLAGKYIRQIEILGVLKNGNFNSLHKDSRPVAFYFETGQRGYMNIRLNSSDLQGAMKQIRGVFEQLFEDSPFEYSFLDHTVEEMYRNDINQSWLLTVFTLLSIVIANIGLFGLVSLLNRKRVREIGIRKVNGAQKWQIVTLLSKQLIIWIAIAIAIAIPVTWWVSRLWLQNFANRISYSWTFVVLGALIILLSAFITTAAMTLRASARNPVDTLRYE